MNIKDIIKMFREEKPNKVSDAHVIQWLNECEAEVQEMLGISPDEWVEYTEADLDDEADTVPIARAPYNRLYLFYLMARLDYANQEFESYGNHQAQYQSMFDDYKTVAYRDGLVISDLPRKFSHVF